MILEAILTETAPSMPECRSPPAAPPTIPLMRQSIETSERARAIETGSDSLRRPGSRFPESLCRKKGWKRSLKGEINTEHECGSDFELVLHHHVGELELELVILFPYADHKRDLLIFQGNGRLAVDFPREQERCGFVPVSRDNDVFQ